MVRELRQWKLLDIPSGITRVVGMVLDRAWPPKIAMPPSHHIDCESRCDVAFRRGHRVFHRVLAPWATRIEKVIVIRLDLLSVVRRLHYPLDFERGLIRPVLFKV
jgi:hypothetical protein